MTGARARPVFVWRRTRGVEGLACALYPEGYDENRTETREEIVARHMIGADDCALSLDELARKFPPPPGVHTREDLA